MRLSVPLAHGLAALALCAAPLLAQANCTSPNSNADYILGDAGGTGAAMHWESGLVWKRCLEGQSGSQCTDGSAQTKPWNDWMVDFMPQPFADLSNWWTSFFGYTPPAMPSNPPNRLLTGDWRMAYKNELVSITENCGNNPKLNRVVFPNAPSSYVWSGSPGAGYTSYAWLVYFFNGVSGHSLRSNGGPVRLVRAGQSFAPLASPTAKTAAAGVTTDFAPITLAPSTGSGQAWGGVRISGDGSPEFQINGAGAWVQEAIVKSGDQITVRLTAPAAGSHTATLTLRSGQTTGTSADASNGGTEATTLIETTADFTLTALAPGPQVPGAPTGVTALAGDGAATLSWTAPSDDGGSPITGYTVTASPASPGGTCTATPPSTTCTISGLTNDTAYTFAVLATNAVGSGVPSTPASATPTAPVAQTLQLPGGAGNASVLIKGGPPGCAVAPSDMAFGTAVPAGHPGAVSSLGALVFTAKGCPGATLNVSITYPAGSLNGLTPYKFGPKTAGAAPSWFAHGTISGDTVSYSVTDDGLGDNDTSTAGQIRDPFAPLLLAAPPPATAQPIPTLGEWGLLLLSALTAALGLGTLRRRQGLGV